MSGIQIVLERRPQSAPSPLFKPLQGVLDVVVDGVNLTARLGEGQAIPLLRDLALAVAELSAARSGRGSVRFYVENEPWELGLTRSDSELLLSVFRAGPMPSVALMDRAVPLEGFQAGLVDGLRALVSDSRTPEAVRQDLSIAAELLSEPCVSPARPLPNKRWEAAEAPAHVGDLAAQVELCLRTWPFTPQRAGVERSDLHSLLVRGRLRLSVRELWRDLGETHLFVVWERLLATATEVMDAFERGMVFYRRFDVEGLRFGIRLTSEGSLDWTAQRVGDRVPQIGATYPRLDPVEFAGLVCAVSRQLVRLITKADRSQHSNLRLIAFRDDSRALRARLRARSNDSSCINEAPESYRAFAMASMNRAPASSGPVSRRLRYVSRWQATVPGLDLRATFLCGDRIVAGGSRETACFHRDTGEILWQRPTTRAISLPTPGGLARIFGDGRIQIHDFGTGEVSMRTRIGPGTAGAAAGTLIHAPGLPQLLILTEGERWLSAVDLRSGEIRWRQRFERRGPCRFRRAGRLLIHASGGPQMTAYDVQSGEVVWRQCQRLPFALRPSLTPDALYAVAGDPLAGTRARSRLLSLDPWSGRLNFAVDLPTRTCPTGAPLIAGDAVAVVVRDERGAGLAAYHRQTGEPLFRVATGRIRGQASWLCVDDQIFANCEDGHFYAFSAQDGSLSYRLQLLDDPEEPVARRLEPVLRNGALFVPQRNVSVVQPGDGKVLGCLQSDAVPDRLRVDERCDVYLAEEGGQLAAYGAAANLTLVR